MASRTVLHIFVDFNVLETYMFFLYFIQPVGLQYANKHGNN